MQNVKRRKKRHGAAAYALFLVIWILILAALTAYLWKTTMRFGEYWEAAQIGPKVDEYMDQFVVEIWENGDNSVQNKIAQMPHEFQTNEECVEILRGILQDDLRCLPSASNTQDHVKTYDLLSGRNKFGQVFLTQQVKQPEENALLNMLIEKFSLYPWKVNGVQFYLDGLYTSFDITVPENYTVLLNGHPLTADYVAETGLPYNVLQDYYSQYDGLPTKVHYHVDNIFGHIDYQLLDEKGNPREIDPDQDDSQFIDPVSDEMLARFAPYVVEFSKRYLEFNAGTGNMSYLYGQLMPYVEKNSDLADRMHRMIDSYAGWQHNSNYRFYDASLNGAVSLGNNIYVLDASANAGCMMPAGYVEVHRDMKIYVRYHPQSGEVMAFSVEDYNTVEVPKDSENAG